MAVPITDPFKRRIQLYGLDTPVIVTFYPHCLEMALLGSQTKLRATWNEISDILTVPETAPSIYVGNSFKLLQHLAAKSKAKKKK